MGPGWWPLQAPWVGWAWACPSMFFGTHPHAHTCQTRHPGPPPLLQVRVDAVVALRLFVDELDDISPLKPILPNVLEAVFGLMNQARMPFAPVPWGYRCAGRAPCPDLSG